MVKEEPLSGGGIRFSTDQGAVEMALPVRHLIVNKYIKHGHAPLAGPLLREMTKVVRSGRSVCIMNDAEELTDYDSGFRQEWTEWLRQNRHQVKAFHLLHGSSLVRIGANLANVILGDLIKGHSGRPAFEAAIAEYMRRPPA